MFEAVRSKRLGLSLGSTQSPGATKASSDDGVASLHTVVHIVIRAAVYPYLEEARGRDSEPIARAFPATLPPYIMYIRESPPSAPQWSPTLGSIADKRLANMIIHRQRCTCTSPRSRALPPARSTPRKTCHAWRARSFCRPRQAAIGRPNNSQTAKRQKGKRGNKLRHVVGLPARSWLTGSLEGPERDRGSGANRWPSLLSTYRWQSVLRIWRELSLSQRVVARIRPHGLVDSR